MSVLVEGLSLFCVVACAVVKVPQVLTLIKNKNTQGVSVTSVLLELLGYGIQTGFYTSESYAISQYLEYPLLVLQDFLLLILLNKYTPSGIPAIKYISGATALIAILASGSVPKNILLLFMSSNLFFSLSSKLAQAKELHSTKNSENVSVIVWIINLSTGAARLYTNLMGKAEPLVLLNLCISVTSNSFVIFLIMLYRRPRQKME